MTLDGVMQAPGGLEEDGEGGFAYGGWSVNYWDDQMGQVMGEAMSRPFDPRSRTQDLRHLRRVLAQRERRCRRQAVE